MLTQNVSHIISSFPLVIFYRGDYTKAPTDTLIGMIEANEKSAKRKAQLRKLMFLSVEAIQNIQRYSAHSISHIDSSLVLCDEKTYQVITSNLVPTSKTTDLKKRFDEIRSKNKEELELHYLSTMDSEEKTEKGSGLGLIEIARKTGQNFLYRLTEIDQQHSLFELCFAFPATKDEPIPVDLNRSLGIHKELYNALNNGSSSFLFSGDFSNNFLLSVLELLLSKRSEGNLNTNKKNHHILIELIQNIRRHGSSSTESSKGKLLLEWKDHELIISTENIGTSGNVETVSKKIVTLNALNKQELELKSKEILLDMESTNGLGLIDIASLIYPNRIGIETYPYNEEYKGLRIEIRSGNE